jgi:pyridoxamine 5'-phosphate oxidase
MNVNIADIHHEYNKKKLTKKSVHKNPLSQLNLWLKEALEVEDEPTAMILGTVSLEGQPATRTVLLKGVDENELVFYTNYQSRKGSHIEHNPRISLTFFWPKLERQINIEGTATKVVSEVSDAYFETRPRTSKLGAWVSPQSRVIRDRNEIIAAFTKLAARYIGRKVPRPDFWGGYAVAPNRFEFWQGRPNRLHDRILFSNQQDGGWQIDRIAP